MSSLPTLEVPVLTTNELPFGICPVEGWAGSRFLLCFRYTNKIRIIMSRTVNATATGIT